MRIGRGSALERLWSVALLAEMLDDSSEDDIVDDIASEYLDNWEQESNDVPLMLGPFSCTDDRDTECRICTEPLQKEQMICVLECKHLFHEECVRKWGRVKPSCPVCRQAIATAETKPDTEEKDTD